VAKVVKGYINPMLQEELSIKLKRETLIDKEANNIIV
jgi:hypothetical protein